MQGFILEAYEKSVSNLQASEADKKAVRDAFRYEIGEINNMYREDGLKLPDSRTVAANITAFQELYGEGKQRYSGAMLRARAPGAELQGSETIGHPIGAVLDMILDYSNNISIEQWHDLVCTKASNGSQHDKGYFLRLFNRNVLNHPLRAMAVYHDQHEHAPRKMKCCVIF